MMTDSEFVRNYGIRSVPYPHTTNTVNLESCDLGATDAAYTSCFDPFWVLKSASLDYAFVI